MINKSKKCWDKSLDISNETLSDKAKANYKSLSKWLVPTRENILCSDLKNAYAKNQKFVHENIYFPPLSGDDSAFVPILTFEADFSKAPPEIAFRLGLLAHNDSAGKLRVFGCRFEVPNPKSNHNFCHRQFTRDPLGMETKLGAYLETVCEGFPQQIPCLLAPAKEAASLLVCLIIDLYGKKSVPLLTSMSSIPGCYKEPLSYIPKC